MGLKVGNKNINYKGYVTTTGAAEKLGISIDTVRRWEKSGKLRAERLDGKNRYFKEADLINFKVLKPLNTAQVAILLGVSESTVRRLEQDGSLIPSREVDGRRKYDALTVSKYLAGLSASIQSPQASGTKVYQNNSQKWNLTSDSKRVGILLIMLILLWIVIFVVQK